MDYVNKTFNSYPATTRELKCILCGRPDSVLFPGKHGDICLECKRIEDKKNDPHNKPRPAMASI